MGVGQDGTIVRSTDNGSTWDNATSQYSKSLYNVFFGKDTFVGVGGDWGANGIIVKSENNGVSFENVTNTPSQFSLQLYTGTYGNDTFVVVGQNGNILKSNDGTTWDNATSPTTKNFMGIAYGE